MATEQEIIKAFRNGASLVANQSAVGALKDAIRRGDYLAAIDAVNIDDAAWDELRVLLVQTYAEGAISEVTGMPYSFRPRWNSASPRAEEYARLVIGNHITLISNDSRDAVRETVADGLAFGRSVDRIALDIVGRRGPNGRTGGVVGLNRQQAQWVANMRRWLVDDPARALDYTRRDRRFDRAIRSAIDGKPLTATQVDAIASAYSDRLLMTRGKTIARTERQSAINAGRQEAWKQAAERAGLPFSAIRKTWVHSSRMMEPRETHIKAGNEKLTVEGLDTPFNIGGFSCLYPHDPSLPASQVVNCGCSVKYSIKRTRNG